MASNRERDGRDLDVDPVDLVEVDPSEAKEPPESWDEVAQLEGEDVLEGVEVIQATQRTEEAAGGAKRGPSINGFPVGPAKRIGVKSYRVPGTTVALSVRASIAPLLIGFARDFHKQVEPLRKGTCWGHAHRKIRGSGKWSFHAAGIAIDLNAPKHPLGRSGTFSRSQRATINALIKKYGLRWGGNYKGRKDEMHFEVILPREQAEARAKQLQGRGRAA